jgi:hypothetical protein
MSVALKIPDATPFHPPLKFSESELDLRDAFIASFNGTRAPGWELHIAVWQLTDELKEIGETPEGVVKRIKYIAAIPISFHYRVGYREGHGRLKAAVNEAIALAIPHYFR